MTGEPNHATVLDTSIRGRWPRPVALAWGRIAVADAPFARRERLIDFSGVLLRTLAAISIVDYVTGPKTADKGGGRDHPEVLLGRLSRPADGDWHKLACRLALECAKREQGAFVPEFARWLQRTHPERETNERALGWIVKLRNDARHSSTPESETAVEQSAAALERELRSLLPGLMWMGDYRIGHVVRADASSTRGRFEGSIDFWIGTDDLPVRVDGAWSGWLARDRVYLFAPDATRVLPLSPIVQIRPTDAYRVDRFFLIARFDDRRSELELADDRSSDVVRVPVEATSSRGSGVRAWFTESDADRQELADVDPKLRSDAELHLLADVKVADKYVLREEIGRGGMGTVFRATHTVLGQDVALKVLNEEVSADPTVRERFIREAQLMHAIGSPNVLQAIDTGFLEDGRLYVASRIAAGGSLAEVVSGGPASTDLVTRWLIDAASGLAAIHSVGVVHRDIKPANLLLSLGRVVVSDLGIARSGEQSKLTMRHEQLGTQPYMAPEQLRGYPATPKSDVYALGVVACELVTGRTDVAAASRTIPGRLGALVRLMCDEDPAQRPTALETARRLAELSAATEPGPETNDLAQARGLDSPHMSHVDLAVPPGPPPHAHAPERDREAHESIGDLVAPSDSGRPRRNLEHVGPGAESDDQAAATDGEPGGTGNKLLDWGATAALIWLVVAIVRHCN